MKEENKKEDKRKNHIIHEVSGRIKYGKDHIDKAKPKRKIDYEKYLVGESFEKFKARLRSESAEANYVYRLYKVCEELNSTTEELANLFSKKDCTALEDRFEKLVNNFKILNIKKECDPRAGELHLRYYAFIKFCEANRININKSYLKGTLPKKPDNGKDTGYTKDQIIEMLDFTDPRSRLIILFFATSGMREGALCNLRVSDIQRVPEKGDLEGAEITIYKNDNEEDKIFCTPECYNAYLAYLKMRRKLGELITPNSPVILRRIPRDREKGWTETKCISDSTVSAILINVTIKAGTRTLSNVYTNINRYDIKITTGFRKYFETTIIDAKDPITGMNKIDPYRADRLLSHMRRGGIKLTKHYDKSEMWQYYKRVIPELTFSKEQEYKVKFEHAEEKIEGLKEAQNYIKERDRDIEELKKQYIESQKLLAEMQEKLDDVVSGKRVKARVSRIITEVPPDVNNAEKLFNGLKTGRIKPKVTEPEDELIISEQGQDALIWKLTELEQELKKVKKEGNKKKVEDINSEINSINEQLDEVISVVPVD